MDVLVWEGTIMIPTVLWKELGGKDENEKDGEPWEGDTCHGGGGTTKQGGDVLYRSVR